MEELKKLEELAKLAKLEELEKLAKLIGILLAVLGSGGIIGIITTFSEIELCKRIYILITVISLTLTLIILLRLWIKVEVGAKTDTPIRYLYQKARGLLIIEFVLGAIFIFSLFLSLFPEAANALSLCAIPASTPTPTPIVTPTQTPTLTPAPTVTPTLTPTSCPLIDAMDDILGWKPYIAPSSESRWADSPMPIDIVPRLSGNAIRLTFYVPQGGWVGMFKNIPAGLLPGTSGIQFSYTSDSLKDIELKLFQQGDGGDILCDVDIPSKFGVGVWKTEQVPYSSLNCSHGKPIDLAKVIRIDFAISARLYGQPGDGEVIIDDIRTMCP